MRVSILNQAMKDLEEGYGFYESQAQGLGAYFLDTLLADIDSLAYFAGIHRTVFGHHRLLSKRFPFAVYYRVAADVAMVIAVLDCRKNPTRTRRRLTKE